MKLADRIIDLMAPFPGRPFRMHEIVKYINPRASQQAEKDAIRKQVLRVLVELQECGNIKIHPASTRGGSNLYCWGAHGLRNSKSDTVEHGCVRN